MQCMFSKVLQNVQKLLLYNHQSLQYVLLTTESKHIDGCVLSEVKNI